MSGAAALIYEIVWVRLLTLSVGHTTVAVSIVLAAFLGGLALGSQWQEVRSGPRSRSTDLRAYIAVELSIGFFGFFSVFVLRPTPSNAFVTLQIVYLLIPTFLMGIAFPLLARHFSTAALYGANTLGGVIGVLAAGFFLVPAVGHKASVWTASALNLLCSAAVFFLLSRKQFENAFERSPETISIEASAGKKGAAFLGVFFALGAGSLVCEIGWTRAFAMILGSSTYAFTIMLATFLLGVGFGSACYARWFNKPKLNTVFVCSLVSVVLSLSVLSYLPLFNELPWAFVKVFRLSASNNLFWFLIQAVLCSFVMILPTFLMGLLFPLSVNAVATAAGSHKVGTFYSAQTFGNIAGSLIAGLFLLPRFGAEKTVLIGSSLYFLSGMAFLILANGVERSLRVSVAGIAGFIFLLLEIVRPSWDPYVMTSGVFIYAPGYLGFSKKSEFLNDLAQNKLIFYRDGVSSSVGVFETPYGDRFLRINGKTDASSGIDMITQFLVGYLPMLVGRAEPESALVIGCGSGVTATAVASSRSIKRLDLVELEPSVIKAAHYFKQINRDVLSDPRLNIAYTDGRRYLAATDKKYDIIASEPSNPWMVGVANLFTKEAFELERDHLAPGGVFCQWFHAYSMSSDDFKLIVRTFQSVFPDAMLFTTGDKDFFLLGSNRPWAIDFKRMVEEFKSNPEMTRDLRTVGLGHPFSFLATTFLLEKEDLRAYAGPDGPIHRDDRPTLEFSSPLYLQRSQDRQITAELMGAKKPEMPSGVIGLNATPAEMAVMHNMAGESYLRAKNLMLAESEFEEAVKLNPNDARTWTNIGRVSFLRDQHFQAEETYKKALKMDPSFALAWFHLGMLYLNQGVMKKGMDCLESGLRHAPGDPMGSLQLSRLYAETGRITDALKILADALKRPIPNADLQNALVTLHKSLSNAQHK